MDQIFSKLSRAILMAALTSFACSTVFAQWQWIDGAGRKVFSDTPPPAGTPDKNIIKRPGAVRAATLPVSAAATAPAAGSATATSPKLSGRDEQLEAKKKQAEEAEQTKKKAEADRMTNARAENCERSKRAKATLDSGIRIATTNTKGEREIMDDKGRASEAKRIDDIIRSDCSPQLQAVQ